MNTLKTVLAHILELDEQTITDETSPDNTPSWDSFNALMIVSELERHYKVKFTMEEVIKVKNVGDIKKVLKKYHIDPES